MTLYREKNLPVAGCPGSIHMTGRDLVTDSQGHQILFAHEGPVVYANIRLRNIEALHAPDHDGFISVCQHCRTVYPCLTMRVGNEDVE